MIGRGREIFGVVASVLLLPVMAAEKPDYSAPERAPYAVEEVKVKTPAGHVLAGTLTLPVGASKSEPVAAVITITGSGPQDRDEYLGIGELRPFRQVADVLGRRGIAVLRMDDRGREHPVARSRVQRVPISRRISERAWLT